jgi:hypothetical protein
LLKSPTPASPATFEFRPGRSRQDQRFINRSNRVTGAKVEKAELIADHRSPGSRRSAGNRSDEGEETQYSSPQRKAPYANRPLVMR